MLYKLLRTDGSPHDRAPFIAGLGRAFRLTAMVCARCGAWGANGLDYPSIAKEELPLELQTLAAPPISVPKWRSLKETPAFAASRGIDVRPGASFGPLTGNTVTTATGLVWRNNWTLLIDEGHATLLAQLGCPLVTVPSPCKSEAGQRMLEIEIREGVGAVEKGSRGSPPTPCAECGRIRAAQVDDEVVRASDEHLKIPLQRIAGRPETIVANRGFVDAAKRLRLTTVMAVGVRTT